jgi:hypothetical protein
MAANANQVVCPRCGEVKLETPEGTRALPTLGMARKAAGAAGECDCGKQHDGGAAAATDVPDSDGAQP